MVRHLEISDLIFLTHGNIIGGTHQVSLEFLLYKSESERPNTRIDVLENKLRDSVA